MNIGIATYRLNGTVLPTPVSQTPIFSTTNSLPANTTLILNFAGASYGLNSLLGEFRTAQAATLDLQLTSGRWLLGIPIRAVSFGAVSLKSTLGAGPLGTIIIGTSYNGKQPTILQTTTPTLLLSLLSTVSLLTPLTAAALY